jgi:Domain of unknown function (DUF4398)
MTHTPLIVTLALLGACATTRTMETEASQSAVRSAEELGAANVPQASLHLQLAKEEIASAIKLDEAGDHTQAASFLMRAEADAELAVALARAETDRAAAAAAVERVHQLQSENPYAPGDAK